MNNEQAKENFYKLISEGETELAWQLLSAAGSQEGWISAKNKPLAILKDDYWTYKVDTDFIAAVPYNDKDKPNEKNLWWIQHCRLVDGIGMCMVLDGEEEGAGWEISDVVYYLPIPPLPAKPHQ